MIFMMIKNQVKQHLREHLIHPVIRKIEVRCLAGLDWPLITPPQFKKHTSSHCSARMVI